MNVGTLAVTQQQAHEAVVHYRRAVKLRHDAEYAAILRGYNQVLKGRKLIELSKVIAAGGADELHRPRIAVMRADQKLCNVEVRHNGAVRFYARERVMRRDLSLSFPRDTVPSWIDKGGRDAWRIQACAIMPLIPPQHMPVTKLAGHHILFEANWTEPPVDPALIKHLGGDLWAVLAMWDLTDLERAVLSGRSDS